MNNIAEGFARFSTKDSIKFYDIAQSSAAEVESMTYILSDLQYLPHETIAMIATKALETKNRTLGLIRYLRRRDTGTRGDKSA